VIRHSSVAVTTEMTTVSPVSTAIPPGLIGSRRTSTRRGAIRDDRNGQHTHPSRDLDRLADLVGDIIRTDNMTVRQR
jgi:hypothetical protein